MRILVADDDPVLRTVISSGMKALGHKVVGCETGAQAWAALRESRFHILITDWSMPEMDGIELTQALRKLPNEFYTYVIMLTGHGTREHYLAGVRAGADAFLIKPMDGALLEAQLSIAARILGQQEHTKQLESIMTVCSYCKRVHAEKEWIGMEEYIAKEFKTLPSHTYCPDCFASKVKPEMDKLGISTKGIGI